MTILQSIILGIVEGITEFLPISSTAHLILASDLLGVVKTDFLKSFEIFIQLGAILSVIILYWRSLIKNFEIYKKLFISFLPTALVGLVLYKSIKQFLMVDSVVVWTLLLGGIALIFFEYLHKEKDDSVQSFDSITYKQAFVIGLFQSLAVVPGVSRAAATIVGGLIVGLNRKTIVEYSFLLAIPTMLAATGLDLIKTSNSFSGYDIKTLLVGFVVSFLVALASIKFLIKYIKNHSFIPFGIYRIIIALTFAVWLFLI